MFPYVAEPSLTVGGHTFHAFGLLAATAVVVGVALVTARAPRAGLDRGECLHLLAWTVISGFVGSHVLSLVAYTPQVLAADPFALLDLLGSMSSFGGILGGIGGGCAAMRLRRMPPVTRLGFIDAVAFAFPFAWTIGRAGCALAHDHLGGLSDHWLAVRFPGGARFDLGLLECLYSAALGGAFLCLDRHPRPAGFYLGSFFALYGPARFALDALRTGEARYLGWTPGQYLSLATVGVGLVFLALSTRTTRAA